MVTLIEDAVKIAAGVREKSAVKLVANVVQSIDPTI